MVMSHLVLEPTPLEITHQNFENQNKIISFEKHKNSINNQFFVFRSTN
jgi:hypothetical protein